MPKLLALLALALLAPQAFAQSQAFNDTVSWTLPTTREDGTPLAASELVTVTLRFGPPGGPYSSERVELLASIGATMFVRSSAGTRCYVATVTDADGVESADSLEACKTIRAKPGRPRIAVK